MITTTKPCLDCGAETPNDSRRKYCADCSAARNAPVPRKTSTCLECSKDITHRHWCAEYCLDCAISRRSVYTRNRKFVGNDNDKSRAITKYAVKVGFLPKPTDFDCVDCGTKAECYDHRDYSKPLDVDPVCLRCNSSRGRGIEVNFPV